MSDVVPDHNAESALPLVVVLGASGFLGAGVLTACIPLPVRLRAVTRSARPSGRSQRPEWRVADLTNPRQLAEAVRDADVVLNLAGITTRAAEIDAERINHGMVLELIDLFSRTRRAPLIVQAGTGSQVGTAGIGRIDGTEPDAPDNAYDAQKLAAEQALEKAHRAGHVRAIALRLATVFGPGPVPSATDRGVVTTMIRKAIAGESLPMWGDGTVTRDLLFVEDAARAFVCAMRYGDHLAGEHYLVGSGMGTPLAELFGSIAKLVAAKSGGSPVSLSSVDIPDTAAASDLIGVEYDCTAFRHATGWHPRVGLLAGLDRTIAALCSAEQ
ncbi:NAD-dependent epimerase/dehydratase family protein [Sciscionella marina]|uniref:NAD-dependent epimerase/dehydratase family protein n=1 Tax=Sciscionella marina TaxID=508770 RepID=UPI00037B635E|nr:NAD-dependent epimerase/dehydratase [Sciscionella marina]